MRKTIAVCVTGYNWQKESRVISGIVSRCKQYDINVLCFATLETRPGIASLRNLSPELLRCESEIFNLINYDMIDGMVCLSEAFLEPEKVFEIHQKCVEHGIPFININDDKVNFEHNIVFSDASAFEAVVRHVVERHGCRKVNLITGFKGNVQSEERLSAYKKVLSEHNIPIEDWRIGYGEFWKKSIDCTREFLKHDIPDAIVCANDCMAILVTDYLWHCGYKVPEQIIVTGFDGTDDAQNCDTTITTIVLDFVQAGITAVECITKLWEGKEIPETIVIGSVLITGESCGCVKPRRQALHNYVDSIYNASNGFKLFNKNIVSMNNSFINAKDGSDLFDGALKALGTLQIGKVFICVNPEMESATDFFYEKSNAYGTDRIPEKVLLIGERNSSSKTGTVFDKANLFPENIMDGEAPIFYAFSPFYFKDKMLGYIAYEPLNCKGESDFFKIWLATLQNNIGSFYMRRGLEMISVHDPLTGLLNRRGMIDRVEMLVAKNLGSDKYFTAICVDVDRLKFVNDTYGHDAGDECILCVSGAIKEINTDHYVCTRTGGDEFTILFVDSDKELAVKKIEQIHSYIENFNNTQKKEFEVSCSCGWNSVRLKDEEGFDVIDRCIKAADVEMYKEKNRKKACRQ